MSGEEVTTTTNSPEKLKLAVESLSTVVPSLSSTTTTHLLTSPEIYPEISALLRKPESGAGDNNLCRWLYDTFQSGVPELQLLVLRFVPIIAGVYLSRVGQRKPQAGFEAVLLALYGHETSTRAGQAVSVTLPDPWNPSVYDQWTKANNKNNNNNDENKVGIVSACLEPHGTVRSTRRARIVGVALELFHAKISHMPVSSKIEFCEFCQTWAGQEGEMYKKFEEEEEGGDVALELEGLEKKKKEKVEGRVPLPWELLQPVIRILGHCLLGGINSNNNKREVKLFDAASEACRCLFARSMHDVNPMAILPLRSLMRLSKTVNNHVDHTELPFSDVVSL